MHASVPYAWRLLPQQTSHLAVIKPLDRWQNCCYMCWVESEDLAHRMSSSLWHNTATWLAEGVRHRLCLLGFPYNASMQLTPVAEHACMQ